MISTVATATAVSDADVTAAEQLTLDTIAGALSGPSHLPVGDDPSGYTRQITAVVRAGQWFLRLPGLCVRVAQGDWKVGLIELHPLLG